MRLSKICLLILAVLCIGWGPMMLSTKPSSLTCTQLYAPSLTRDSNYGFGQYNSQEIVGTKYTPASNQTICQVKIYTGTGAGDRSDRDYYMGIWVLGTGGDLDKLTDDMSGEGISDAFPGEDMSNNSWETFVFSTPVAVTSGTAYGLGIFPDTDSNLTDDPEVDSGKYFSWGYDNENAGDAVLGGYVRWSYGAGSFPLATSGQDVEDDMLIEVWTMQ
jgi:hypothetical protein